MPAAIERGLATPTIKTRLPCKNPMGSLLKLTNKRIKLA
jgi:hypothetical protein